MEMEELKQKRCTNGKEAVRGIKDVALAQEKCAILNINICIAVASVSDMTLFSD
ncbi:hypothetical protein Plhal304r1_c021g0074311 [Plasmopara halstedii]